MNYVNANYRQSLTMHASLTKSLTLLLGTSLLLGLQACSPLRVINGVIDDGAYQLTKNIAYGGHPQQKLDVYQPSEPCDQCPVLIWLYGGAWSSGDKDLYTFVGEAFAAAGMVVVIPDYRQYPGNLFPDFINDAAAALSWVKENISDYGGNAEKLNLMGHSAGAHISMMLAFDPQYLARVEMPTSSIRAVIGLAGPYDFLPIREAYIRKIFSTAKPLESSQPISFASAAAPPVLLAMGLKDKRVDPQNSVRMATAIEAQGGRVQVISYPDIGHSKILLSLSRPLRASSDVYHDTLAFIKSIEVAQP